MARPRGEQGWAVVIGDVHIGEVVGSSCPAPIPGKGILRSAGPGFGAAIEWTCLAELKRGCSSRSLGILPVGPPRSFRACHAAPPSAVRWTGVAELEGH